MPPIEQIVETAIYVDDLDRAEAFYSEVLGLPVIIKEAGRHVFFRVGAADMLLAFRAEKTITEKDFAPHGAVGPSHFALGIPTDSLAAWREHLRLNGVAIELELTWPGGGQSVYFRDPAGNSAELITRGVWGTPAGW